MMKCVITSEETKNKTNNFPLSRKGRLMLIDITNRYNDKLKDKFIESFIEKSGNESEETIKAVSKLAPKMSKHDMLKMLDKESEEDLFAKFDNVEEDKPAFEKAVDAKLEQNKKEAEKIKIQDEKDMLDVQGAKDGGRMGYKNGSKCKLATKGKGKAYGKNS